MHSLCTFSKASPLKRWLVIVDRNQDLSLLAVEKDLSGEQEVAGLIKSSFIMRIMFGISSLSLSGQVLILLYTSLKHPTLKFDIMVRNTFASTSRASMSISSPYISGSKASVGTSLFPVGAVACIKRDLFLKSQEQANTTIASLTAEIKRLNENFQKLESDVSVVKNVNNILSKQTSSIERQCWKNAQYSRRECVGVVGLPSSIEDKDLQTKCFSILVLA